MWAHDAWARGRFFACFRAGYFVPFTREKSRRKKGLDFCRKLPLPLASAMLPVKLQTSSVMNTSIKPRIQALLELFWTANPEHLWLDAEFCELSCDEQEAIIDELTD
jgi:hypothetical protein